MCVLTPGDLMQLTGLQTPRTDLTGLLNSQIGEKSGKWLVSHHRGPAVVISLLFPADSKGTED